MVSGGWEAFPSLSVAEGPHLPDAVSAGAGEVFEYVDFAPWGD